LRWHQALAYALLGRADERLGRQQRLDLARLLDDLDAGYPDGREGLQAEIARLRRSADLGSPRVVPGELMAGLGRAQFAAALGELRQILDLDVAVRRTLSTRPPDAAEQALLREVPPHHGN
jgi:hypothetical protein